MAKKKKETIGIIRGRDLLKKAAPKADVTFKTGRHMTDKDRPRDKKWRNWEEDYGEDVAGDVLQLYTPSMEDGIVALEITKEDYLAQEG